MNKSEYDYIKVPKEHLELMMETLYLDTQCSMFDEELKTSITNALESVVFLSDYDIEILQKLDIEREENEQWEIKE